MRFGYQTIVFGRRFRDRESFAHAMSVIAGAGFEGVELFQAPAALGLTGITSAAELMELLRTDFKLDLIGLSGGRVEDRIKFLGGEISPYLYLDGLPSREKMIEWLQAGYRLALHPHAFKPIRCLGDAERILNLPDFREYANLLLLPDTAHLTIANDSPILAVRNNQKRLAAIHIKGWDASYGRASHRYSRGFCELFRGDAPVQSVLDELKGDHYPPGTWVVVELDYSLRPPDEVVRASAEALMQKGLMTRRDFRMPATTTGLPPREVFSETELRFRRELESRIADPSRDYYQKGLRALVTSCQGAKAAALFALSEVNGQLTPVCTTEDWIPDDLSSISAPDLAAELMGLEYPRPERLGRSTLPWPWERKLWDGRSRYRVPIFNTFNANHVRFVSNVYFDLNVAPDADQLMALSPILGRFLALKLDEDCMQLGGRVPILAERSDLIGTYIGRVRQHIQDAVPCEAMSFFLADPTGTVLKPLGGETSLLWAHNRQRSALQVFSPDDDDDFVRTWQARVPLWIEVESEPQNAACRLVLTKRNTHNKMYLLFFPMIDPHGRCSGVIGIGNATEADRVRGFHDDDLARIDAILQLAIPRIEALQAEDLRRQQVQNVSHELKQPAMLIRGFLDLIQKTIKDKNITLEYDWITDALSWCELMQNLVTNPDYMRLGNYRPRIQLEKVSLHADVIAPLCRVLTQTLKQRRLPRYLSNSTPEFPKYTIEQGEFDIPKPIFVDRNMMQQVFFNLLDNAIKYADPDRRSDFHVVLFGETHGRDFVIRIQDSGIGIDVADLDSLFDEGVRAPSAARYAKGTGFGLAVVRRLVEAHAGKVEVTRARNPTELTVTLPAILQQRDWQKFV